MARVPLDISNGFYESFAPQFADLICNNLRPVVPESEAYSQTALRATDGIDSFIESTYKTSRGAIEVNDVAYFVQANQFISVASDGTITAYGTISGTGLVSMANSSTYIWIVVPETDSYYFNIGTGTLTLNADPNFLGPATSVRFKDSFFFFTTDSIVFNSDLDGITFTPTDYGTAEVDPDKIWTGEVCNGQYYAIGSRTIQPYQTVGGSGFPLDPIVNGTIERGLAARFAIAKADNTFFFMGGGDQQEVAIWRFTGNSAVKISTPAVDHYIQGLTNTQIESCFAFSYQTDGEEFVCFTFPNRTLVYQIYTSQKKGRNIWHERTSNDSRWRVNTIVRAHNKLYVGDELTDKIGILNPATPTEFGDTVFREFSTQPFNFDGAPAFVGSYELVMTTGVGNSSSTNPVVTHTYSEDGINFSPMFTREIGAVGEFSTRVIWRRMGRIARQRVLKFSVNEPCIVAFYRIEAEVIGA
jgi:hypothetical protein